jgi:hypothetical protein
MRFANHTPLPAALVPNAEDGDDMTALVICAVTFAIIPTPEGKEADGSTLQLTRAQRPLHTGPGLEIPGDDHFLREGVSVTASGHVHAPGGKATKADAILKVGNEKRVVRAFGPRVFREGVLGALTATAPLPFDRVPMTWDNTYGGVVMRKTTTVKRDGQETIVPEHPVFYPYNSDGKGFYLERADALEQPLPPLENPDQLIRDWDDQPLPVCFAPYPVHGAMRVLAMKTEDDQIDVTLFPRTTGRAAPWLVFPRLDPGTPIVLRGMRPRGETLAFNVPPPPVRVRVVLGGLQVRLDMLLDSIDIDADAAEVRFVHRTSFRFTLFQEELREAHLEPTEHFPKLHAKPRGERDGQ